MKDCRGGSLTLGRAVFFFTEVASLYLLQRLHKYGSNALACNLARRERTNWLDAEWNGSGIYFSIINNIFCIVPTLQSTSLFSGLPSGCLFYCIRRWGNDECAHLSAKAENDSLYGNLTYRPYDRNFFFFSPSWPQKFFWFFKPMRNLYLLLLISQLFVLLFVCVMWFFVLFFKVSLSPFVTNSSSSSRKDSCSRVLLSNRHPFINSN